MTVEHTGGRIAPRGRHDREGRRYRHDRRGHHDPRGRGLIAAFLAAFLLAGCAAGGSGSTQEPRPAQPVLAPEVVETVAPTTAPPTRGVDVSLADIRSAPAVCGVPEHHLSGYRGHVGSTETTLQVTDGYALGMQPVEPVEVDVTGDGGLDLVGVISCTVDGAARPDSLVLYTGPATPVTSLDLGTVGREKLAVVRALRTPGGEVRVEWTGFDSPSAPGTQYEGTVEHRGGRLVIEDVRRSSGPRTIEVTDGAFMTADGNVHCTMHDDIAWCDVRTTTWRPPASPTSPPGVSGTPTPVGTPTPSAATTPSSAASGADGAGTASPATGCEGRPYGRTFLVQAGRARQTCAGEEGPESAALGAPLTAWHRRGWDATVVIDGRRSAALTPGSTMRTSAVTCRATASAVACTDTRTQASFEVGRTVSRVSSS